MFEFTPLPRRACTAALLLAAAMWAPAKLHAEPVVASIEINSVSLVEGNSGTTLFRFTVSLGEPAPVGGVTFDIGTVDDSAVAGLDYEAKFLAAQTIAAGESQYLFDVNVFGDTVAESVGPGPFNRYELFTVNITNLVNAIAIDTIGEGFILDDDDGRSVPEPSSFALAAASLFSLAARRRRRILRRLA